MIAATKKQEPFDFEVEIGFTDPDKEQRRAFALRLMRSNASVRGRQVDPESLREYQITGRPQYRTWKGRVLTGPQQLGIDNA